jgi:hypothetical protein
MKSVEVEARLAALELRVAQLESADIAELAKSNAGKAEAVRALGLRVADFDHDYLFYVTPRTETPTVRCMVCGSESAVTRLPQGLVHAAGCRLDAGR